MRKRYSRSYTVLSFLTMFSYRELPFRYFKNYLASIRGYSEARLLVFDLEAGEIFGNRAAKEMVKGYRKAGILK